MTKKMSKEQAGKNLLAAIDDYIYAVLEVHSEEKKLARNKRLCKSSEEFRKMLSGSPECKPGPYEQCLRERVHG